MKIYVDEMPKNCEDCRLCRSGVLKVRRNGRYVDAKCCVLGGYYKYQTIDDEIDTCPLQSIADHDAELLRNAIVPKFQIGQEVWVVYTRDQIAPINATVTGVRYDSDHEYSKFHYDTENHLYIGLPECELFGTETEAEQKLKEIQGEN